MVRVEERIINMFSVEITEKHTQKSPAVTISSHLNCSLQLNITLMISCIVLDHYKSVLGDLAPGELPPS